MRVPDLTNEVADRVNSVADLINEVAELDSPRRVSSIRDITDPVLADLFRIIARMSAACRAAAAELLHMFIMSRQALTREQQR